MLKPNLYDLQFRSQITDLGRRNNYCLKELDNTVLKSILEIGPVKDLGDLNTKFILSNRLQNLKQGTITRVRNRCVLTGRSSTLKRFRLSRISFREQASSGKLIGVSKILNK